MSGKPSTKKQNLTVRLTRKTVRQAKMLAARRKISVRALLVELIEGLVRQGDV